MPGLKQHLTDTLSLTYHIENTPLGCIVLDKRGHVMYWSARAEEIFGWTAEEMKNSNAFEMPFIYQEDLELVQSVVENLKTGKLQRNQVVNRNYTKSGEVIYCEWYNSSLRDDQGEVISVLCLVQDITERKEAEQALAKSQQQLSLIYHS